MGILSMGCPGEPEERYSPLAGTVRDEAGAGIDSVQVLVSATGFSRNTAGKILGILGSGYTDNQGLYHLAFGFPTYWERRGACTNAPQAYIGMQEFILIITKQHYDTTVVAFLSDSSFVNIYSNLVQPADTVIIGEHNFGIEGDKRIAPDITLRRR